MAVWSLWMVWSTLLSPALVENNIISQNVRLMINVCILLDVYKRQGQYYLISPWVEMVITSKGSCLPLRRSASSAARCKPPQQGTSIRTTVMLLMLLLAMMAASFLL